MSVNAHDTPIPQPPASLLLGNLRDIDRHHPIESLMRLARAYGPIFQLARPGGAHPLVVISSLDLVDEVCDDKRFDKTVTGGDRGIRSIGGDGLFTAWTHEPNWHRAHNILLPNFSQRAMQGYLPQMVDLAVQLVQKWARLNPGESVDVAADMTRVTLDTIGLCGFDYRFNSFYRDTPHPFVAAMTRALSGAQRHSSQLPIQSKLNVKAEQRLIEDIAFMNNMVDGLIQERRGTARAAGTDLLQYMLDGVDPETGERLDDLNIRYQVLTFLIAGHETTSSLLTFAVYFLLKHPDVLAMARAEVDDVLGPDPDVLPTFSQVHRLRYCHQVLNESLRLWPTAPALSRYPYEDTVLGGKYRIAKGGQVMVLTPVLHRDRQVWGDDAEAFNPDHFRPERAERIPPNAFKPFGHGQRACIGRQFALQEAALILGMILQRFDLVDHLNYQLDIRQTLTIKPNGLSMQVRPRGGRTPIPRAMSPAPAAAVAPGLAAPLPCPAPPAGAHGTPLLVLFGSNLGTAEGLARQIARDGARLGFAAQVASMDASPEPLPTRGALIAVTASYNGQPPDNAVQFCARLTAPGLAADACAGVRFTVFGCGNRDWAATYQAVPELVERQLAAHGAQCIYPRGAGDARADFDGQFQAWYQPLWAALGEACGISSAGLPPPTAAAANLAVQVVPTPLGEPARTSFRAQPMVVRLQRELQQQAGVRPSGRSTRHLEIELPPDVTYQAGDHLGVLPRNSAAAIRRVLDRFGLDANAYIIIEPGPALPDHLPGGRPVALADLLANVVELQDPAPRAHIAGIAALASDPGEATHLASLAADSADGTTRYEEEVLGKHRSVLDILEEHPSCQVTLGHFLAMLPALRPRYYSISSSPLVDPRRCSITVGVVAGPARRGSGRYQGVCSQHLADRPVGSPVFAFIRHPNQPFHPPENPHQPMIMVGPGTGLAPFRGFLQERAALKRRGVPVGDAILFFGCRDPEQDFLYADELRAMEAEGVLQLHVAYSRLPGQPKVYVQQRIVERAADLWPMLQQGAAVFVCGDAARMAPAVRAAFTTVAQTQGGLPAAEAALWLADLRQTGRYMEDVWGGSAG